MEKTALVTGFEAYGGRSCNPSEQLSQAVHDAVIGGFRVVGRRLPVALDGLAHRIEALLDELRPGLVVALGLWPGEPAIRLERFAVNLADFDIADNAGARHRDAAVAPGGASVLAQSLPLRAIEEALLAEGIPVRLSSTAGTYLCNATLHHLLAGLEQRRWSAPCGFIHLPYLPEQVAAMLGEARAGRLAINQRADLASMDFAVMERALHTALAVAAAAADAARPRAG
jgi:pyroglutamyl-peptidase